MNKKGYCKQNGIPTPNSPIEIETFTVWQDPTIEVLKKEINKLTAESTEWESKCYKYKEVLDKALYWLSENTHYTDFNVDKLVLDENANLKDILEILEEIE